MPSNQLTYTWYYQESCSSPTSTIISINSASPHSANTLNTGSLTADTIYIEDAPGSFTVPVVLATGSVIWATTGFSSGGNFGSSASPMFEIGVGFCPGQGQEPAGNESTADAARMVPFTGPTLNTPAIPSSVKPGSALTLSGSNLSGVSRVEIGGLNAEVKVNAAGELEIVVPAGLASGTFDIVLVSDQGRVTVQSAITIRAGAGLSAAGESRPSTKRMDDSSAKVYFYGAVGAGKVQFLLNGKEVAWVNATDASDRKLFDGYLVRTITLDPGKNVIEILVDGVQVRRTVYTR